MDDHDDLEIMTDAEGRQDGPDKPVTLNKDGQPRKVRELFPVSPAPLPRPPREREPMGTPPTADELAAAALAPMTSALDRAGVTDDLIASTILAGMKAHKVVTASFEGKITDAASYQDAKINLEAAALAAKLKGHMVDRSIRDVRSQSIIYVSSIDRRDPAEAASPPIDIGKAGPE